MTKWSNKKLKITRYLSYWLYVLFTIGIPIALVAWQFGLFKEPQPRQLTGWAIILVIIACFIFGKHIKRAIADMELGVPKTILRDVTMITPFLALWIVLTFMEAYVSQLRFIIFWTMLGLLLSSFLDLWHTLIIQEIRKRDRRH